MEPLPELTEEENIIAEQEGYRIFGTLRKKYSNNTVHDLDIVLNSLCCALIRLGRLNVDPVDKENFANLIKHIIIKNFGK